MASSTSSIASPTFNGSSTFSSSFQTVLTNAVPRASLPMQQMQNDVTTLTGQQSALTQLESTFQSLDTALQNIGSTSAGNISATPSDPTVVSAATTSSALPGTYSIQVGNLGSFSTALSPPGRYRNNRSYYSEPQRRLFLYTHGERRQHHHHAVR